MIKPNRGKGATSPLSRVVFFAAMMVYLPQTEPIPPIEGGRGRVRHTQGDPSTWMGGQITSRHRTSAYPRGGLRTVTYHSGVNSGLLYFDSELLELFKILLDPTRNLSRRSPSIHRLRDLCPPSNNLEWTQLWMWMGLTYSFHRRVSPQAVAPKGVAPLPTTPF